MDNIRFGRPTASDEEVIEAAKVVGADEFISKLADGYATEVEERGSILSAGERQLLSFARALLADPSILMMHEATASIDTETEVETQTELAIVMEGMTAIIIEDLPSTIRGADNMYVVESGKVLDNGTHDELMERQGECSGLLQSQFKMLDAM